MSRATTRRRGAAVLLVTAALGAVLAGCGRGDDSVRVSATGAPAGPSATGSAQASSPATGTTAPHSSVASSSVASSSVASGPVASGAGTASDATTAPSTLPSAAPTSAPASTGSASASAGPASGAPAAAGSWPKALGEPTQGQPAWGVYLAVGHSATDPAVEKAVRQAGGVGYGAVVGDIACDGGALEALGLDQFDYWTGATLYFPSQADARSFAAAYSARVAKPEGVVKVKVGCLD